MSGSWRAVCIQKYRRGLSVSQEESTQPRAYRVVWIAPASDGRGVLSDSVTLC